MATSSSCNHEILEFRIIVNQEIAIKRVAVQAHSTRKISYDSSAERDREGNLRKAIS
jgi:hypothetical protein